MWVYDPPALVEPWYTKQSYLKLSDPDKSVEKAYGVLAPAGYAQRWTFVIDREGTIRAIDKKVNFASHGKDLARELEELRIPRR